MLCPAPRSTPPTRSGKCWDLSDSSSSESCRQSSRAELGDLNVIIQVEEWHSSDRFGGTGTGAGIGPSGTRKCR